MTRRFQIVLTSALVAATPVIGFAATDGMTTGADKAEVKSEELGDFVTLNGVVKDVVADTFELDYGSGTITVEMDDYEWDSDNPLLVGDVVEVRGRMDEDFFDKQRIEASSVYVEKLKTHFYANPADEEFTSNFAAMGGFSPEDDEWVSVSGFVESLAPSDGFALDVGLKNITVDASGAAVMPDLEEGDRVYVYGEMDDADLYEKREMLAQSVIETSG